MTYVVAAASGKTVNLRSTPNGAIIKAVPLGATASMLTYDENWSYIEVDGTKGYMMTKYLIAPDSIVSKDDLQKLYASLQTSLKLVESILNK